MSYPQARITTSIRFHSDLYERAKSYAAHEGLSLSGLIQYALGVYLDAHEDDEEENNGEEDGSEKIAFDGEAAEPEQAEEEDEDQS